MRNAFNINAALIEMNNAGLMSPENQLGTLLQAGEQPAVSVAAGLARVVRVPAGAGLSQAGTGVSSGDRQGRR